MKHFFSIFLFAFPISCLAQEPLIYFDKTRCQKQAEIILKTNQEWPYLLDAVKLISVDIHPSAISLWEKVDQNFIQRKLELGNEKQIHFTNSGNFLLLVFDTINPQWIEFSIQENQIHIAPYINCALHY